ncbi:MAG: DNRLRE domain-containing protein [Desulfurococcaceae archaeon]
MGKLRSSWRREKGLLFPMVLSALLMLGILGTVGYLFSMPAVISKLVQTSEGEEVKLTVSVGMRPSFWDYAARQFQLAWRVGTTPRSTVNIRFQITVTGTNIANTATAYFYVEARDASGSPSYREINYASGTSITVGSPVVYETGSMAIDTHLSHIYGSAPTSDKTVKYYVWCKIVATGLISGQQLVAEIPVTQFDTVLYDYGTQTSVSHSIGYCAHVYKYSPNTNYGSSTYVSVGGLDTSYEYHTYIEWDASVPYSGDQVLSASLKLYVAVASTVQVGVYSTGDFSESTITWNNRPAPQTLLGSFTPSSLGWVSFTSNDFLSYFRSCVYLSGSNYYLTIRLALVPITTGSKADFCSDDYSDSTRRPYFEVVYADWSASWSWLNLDTLSISGLQITQDLAPLMLVFIAAICVYLLMRRR